MRLTNLRRIATSDGPGMAADFTAPDGRMGSVTVSLAEYETYGDRVMGTIAIARLAQVAGDGYIPPERDRFSELG